MVTDAELEETGNDPFLIAYALRDPTGRIVVTKEVTKRTQRRGRCKVPDVCDDLGVQWMNDFTLYKAANFRIT